MDPATKNLTSLELKQEVYNFINTSTFTPASTKTCITLLKTLPSAREGVLEHLCHVFDDALSTHIAHLKNFNLNTNNLSFNAASTFDETENIIHDVHSVLNNFVTAQPEAWSPIISTWSLELLGHLSSKYAGVLGVPHHSNDSNLSDVLQLWMTCRASRTLIDLTTQCISTLIATNPDMCIDALLDTSVQHSPHFDWVVAHIGSCFPNTIINRVLACGLKDFSNNETAAASMFPTDKKVPKLASVVGILSHLAGRHSDDVRKALLSLFEESFSIPATEQQLATVPFLLHLASMSEVLLRVVAVDFLSTLTPEVLNCLSKQIQSWRPRSDITSLITHLILSSEEGGPRAIHFLLTTTQNIDVCQDVKIAAGHLLDNVFLELQRLIYASSAIDVPLLHSVQRDVASLTSLLLFGPVSWTQWLLPFLTDIGIYGGQRAVHCILGNLLSSPAPASRLKVMTNLMTSFEIARVTSVTSLIDQLLLDDPTQEKEKENVKTSGTLKNLLPLLQGSPSLNTLNNIHVFARRLLFSSADSRHETADILALLVRQISTNTSVLTATHLSRCIVRYFFNVLQESTDVVKIRQAKTCKQIVTSLSLNSASRNYLLRLIIEGSISDKYRKLFGSSFTDTNNNNDKIYNNNKCQFLSNENRNKSSTLQRVHSAILRKPQPQMTSSIASKTQSQSSIRLNSQLLIDILHVLCAEGSDAMAFILVELISPDVMNNGITWPEEEYSKITIERDLQIKRHFDNNPILWRFLLLLGEYNPSFQQCSVLLRSLLAVAMSHWSSCQATIVKHCSVYLDFCISVMEVMSSWRLLPVPLSHCCELFPLLTPYEVYILLSDVWQVVKDSPTCVDDVSSNMTLHLHHILQKHIHLFGDIYVKFFSGDVA